MDTFRHALPKEDVELLDMNRPLQHFVDSSGSQGPAASRPPIPAPPQSSGGSYHAGNRGSYQRAAPNGPFYYQPPQAPHWQQRSGSGLEEIPLTSQSTGGVYETVDLNADSSQQHRPPQPQQQQQRLFTPSPAGFRPPSTPNSQGQSFGYKAATPPGSREGNKTPFYQQKAPGSTGSAAELFANAPPPARELFGGPPSSNGSGGNPYRRQSNPGSNSFAASPANTHGGAMFANNTTPPKDPFAASPANQNGQSVYGHNTPMKDPFAAPPNANGGSGGVGHSTPPPNQPFAASPSQNGGAFGAQASQHDPFAAEGNRNAFGGEPVRADASAHDPFAVQQAMNSGLQQQQQHEQHQGQQLHSTSSESSADPFASSSSASSADPFASTPSHLTSSVSPFASASSYSSNSAFGSSAPANGEHPRMASADSLFSSPAPTNNGDWAQPAQPEPSPDRAQNLFASDAPTASSLFGGDAPSQLQAGPPAPSKSQINASPSPAKPQATVPPLPVNHHTGIPPSFAKSPVNVPPSPARSPVNAPPSPMRRPVGAPPSPMTNASSPPMRPQVTIPASPVMRPEDYLTPAFGTMKLSTPAKSPLKSGLDVRHMKFPASKRDDDAVSNAPSMAPSRMSMLSTLDDSLKLSDMYKQMTARLEGEKHDLLKVVASQAQEISQMKKQIQSLELQLKKCRPQNV